MPSETNAWIRQQIDNASVAAASTESVVRGDTGALTRLADAAAVLLRPRPGAQVFGLAVPAEGVDGADDLGAHCLERMREWARIVDPRTHDDFAKLLERLGLPALFEPRAPMSPSHRLTLCVGADVENADTSEAVTDPAILSAFDGATVLGTSLVDIDCVRAVTGDGANAWAIEGAARLCARGGELACELSFDLVRAPTDSEVEALRQVVERELFFTSWGLNLDWDVPESAVDLDELLVQTQTTVVSHRLEVLPVADSQR